MRAEPDRHYAKLAFGLFTHLLLSAVSKGTSNETKTPKANLAKWRKQI